MLTNRENERLHDVKMAPEMYASGENAASFPRVHGGLTVNQSNRDLSTVLVTKNMRGRNVRAGRAKLQIGHLFYPVVPIG